MEFKGTTELGSEVLNVANRVSRTEAEGPGVRYALWVQGCPLRCPGCCNPHMLEDRRESLEGWEQVADEIIATEGIEGVTMIGGEPFWQAGALAKVARKVREAGLSVMVFTGQTVERLRRAGRQDYDAFLAEIDLLVDGPYVEKLFVDDRRWIGSSNQRVHFLTDRYAHLKDDRGVWDEGSNTIELRMVGNEVTINGFPEESIVALSAASITVKKAAGE